MNAGLSWNDGVPARAEKVGEKAGGDPGPRVEGEKAGLRVASESCRGEAKGRMTGVSA